jgi:hypothetical protein
LFVTILGCATQPSPAAPSPKPSSSALAPAFVSVDEDTPQAVAAIVIRAQREYLERGDTKALSNLFLPDAEIQAGRTHAPDSLDFVLGKDQLIDIYDWGAKNDGQFDAEFTIVEARRTQNPADLQMRLDTTDSTGEKSSFGQRFALERRSGVWRIVRFRYWPLDPETGEEFTQFFRDTDALIERNLADGDLRNAAYHMMLAYRFEECATLSRRLTNDGPDDPWAWDIRARASSMIGDRKDADQSIQISRTLMNQQHQ